MRQAWSSDAAPPPQDEAARRPDFLEFRQRVRDAISRRDAEAIVRMAHPDVQVDLGGGDGVEFLRSAINNRADFWGEFGRALAMGGTFDERGFSAPYVSSAWPGEFDS